MLEQYCIPTASAVHGSTVNSRILEDRVTAVSTCRALGTGPYDVWPHSDMGVRGEGSGTASSQSPASMLRLNKLLVTGRETAQGGTGVSR